jgi:tetratricopeptide (TPR) repeat protein
MEGKTSDARREYQKSESLSPLNLPAQILNIRLERDLSLRLALIDKTLETENPAGELLVERGRVLLDLGRFAESVEAYDTAYARLDKKDYYEETYRIFSDKANELASLRQGAGDRTAELSSREEITWRELIEITGRETRLLRFITGDQQPSVETLFSQMLDREIIPGTQDATLTEWPFLKPSSSEVVLRSGAAWFIWHIAAENSANRGLLTRYSARLANTPNARSPVPDIGVSSPFIDSVLGCVETGLMSLPDGKNFQPNEKINGADYLSILKKTAPQR